MKVVKPYGYDAIVYNKTRQEIISKMKELNEIATKYSKMRKAIWEYIRDALRLCFPTKTSKIEITDDRGYRTSYLVFSRYHLGTQWYKRCHIDELTLDNEDNRQLLRNHYSEILKLVKKDKIDTFKRIWKFFEYYSSQTLPTQELFESEPFFYKREDGVDSDKPKSIAIEINNSFVYIVFGDYPQRGKKIYWRDRVHLDEYHNAIDYYELLPVIKALTIKVEKWLNKMLKRVQTIWNSEDFQWIKEYVEIYASLRDL